MLGINWLYDYYRRYQHWKLFNKQSDPAKYRGFWPSETYYKYPKESTFQGMKVLNVGCGTTTYPSKNVVNLDGFAGEGVNLVWDLSNLPLPFMDQEFDFVIANHILEHVPNWFDCFKELARIVKVGGQIEVWIPPVSSDSAFTYRDHINRIGVESFWGCDGYGKRGANLWSSVYEQVGHVGNLRLVQKTDRPAMFWWSLFAPDWLSEWFTKHLRNCVSETGFLFRKIRHE